MQPQTILVVERTTSPQTGDTITYRARFLRWLSDAEKSTRTDGADLLAQDGFGNWLYLNSTVALPE